MAGVENDRIARRVEYPVYGDAQFDRTQIRAEVPARPGGGPDKYVADLCREHGQLVARQASQITRALDAFEHTQPSLLPRDLARNRVYQLMRQSRCPTGVAWPLVVLSGSIE
jgi:hypothetical protein